MSHLAVEVVRNALEVGIARTSERLRLPGGAFREPDPEEVANLRLGAGFLQRIGIGAELQRSGVLAPSSLSPSVARILGNRSIRRAEISWGDFSNRVRTDVDSLQRVVGALIDGTSLAQARHPFFDMEDQARAPRPLHQQVVTMKVGAVSVFFRDWFQRQAADPETRAVWVDLDPLTRVRTSEAGQVRLSFWGPAESVRTEEAEKFDGFLIPQPTGLPTLPEYPNDRFGDFLAPYDRDPTLIRDNDNSRVVVRRDLQTGREYLFEAPRYNAASDRMFRRKWRVADRLRDHCSPHLARPRGLFRTSGGLMILAHDFIRGITLQGLIDAGRLPLGRTVEIGLDLLTALGEVHRAGLLHRDVTPSNVLIRPDGSAVLLDFGISEELDPATSRMRPERVLTPEGNTEGTPGYRAPEANYRVISGAEPPGPAYDQYSLGVLLHEMATGRHPFPALLPAAEFNAHAIPAHAPRFDGQGLEEVVIRATRHHEADRYPNLRTMREALAAWKREFGPSPSPR